MAGGQGKTIQELAPNLFTAIPKRIIKHRTVSQALLNRGWVDDIKGALTVQQGVADQHLWNSLRMGLTPPNQLTMLSLWEQFILHLGRGFGGPGLLPNAIWTADRLAKRGLPHPTVCPLCDEETESIQHLLVSCVFTKQGLGLSSLPQPEDRSFMGWSNAVCWAPKDLKKGLSSLFILVAWEVWKHRNACVFERANPEVLVVLQNIANEGSLWCSAGAKDLQVLLEGAR
ncbi:hypothetical protein U9M48_030806, partial [Paspalum notatum var. saurae]